MDTGKAIKTKREIVFARSYLKLALAAKTELNGIMRNCKMGLFKNFVSQTRKTEGVLGKMMVNGMNGGHARMADWGLSYLRSIAPEDIVEIGCGGGRNAGELDYT